MKRKTASRKRKSPKTSSGSARRVPKASSITARGTPKIADFEDEDAVLAEVAKVLDEESSSLRIRRGSAPNGYGDAYQITSRSREWYVMENDDEFRAAAVNGVERDLVDEPEMFPTDFLQGHINMEKLRDELMSDVTDSNLESLRDEAEQHPIRFLKDNSIDLPEPSEKQIREWADAFDKTEDDLTKFRAQDAEDQWIEIGEEPTVTDSDIEEVAESLARDQLRYPMEYLRDIYGDDTAKKAIEIAGIDYKAAADEAVSTDGPEHFMCSYDGNYQTTPSGFIQTTPSGFILWRHN